MAGDAAAQSTGKRVSWVELYLDLIVVLAVGQLSHLIAAEPTSHSVWVALGLFVTIWWTWIGFAVLYNRRGDEQDLASRLAILAGSVPMGVAAVALEPAAIGDTGVFAASMAVVRLVLAFAHAGGEGRISALNIRIGRAYVVSAALFAVSIVVPEPWRYVLWAIAVAGESGAVLTEQRGARRRARARHSLEALAPADPEEALDAHHFAERFGLFIIILLGEVVVEAGQASVDGHVAGADGWGALVAAMILAAALWWLYFDAAAEINLRVLQLSGGSPTIARTLFAFGHMLPAFGLLLTAAGVGLLLEHETPTAAYWLASTGVGISFVGTRVVFAAVTLAGRLGRTAVVVATFWFGALHHVLSPHAYLWVLTAWAVVWTASASWRTRHMDLEALVQPR